MPLNTDAELALTFPVTRYYGQVDYFRIVQGFGSFVRSPNRRC
jgi:hypothetical protein